MVGVIANEGCKSGKGGMVEGVVKEGGVLLSALAHVAVGEGNEAAADGGGEVADGGGEPEGSVLGGLFMEEAAVEVVAVVAGSGVLDDVGHGAMAGEGGEVGKARGDEIRDVKLAVVGCGDFGAGEAIGVGAGAEDGRTTIGGGGGAVEAGN
jgi:hypothetical protein